MKLKHRIRRWFENVALFGLTAKQRHYRRKLQAEIEALQQRARYQKWYDEATQLVERQCLLSTSRHVATKNPCNAAIVAALLQLLDTEGRQ